MNLLHFLTNLGLFNATCRLFTVFFHICTTTFSQIVASDPHLRYIPFKTSFHSHQPRKKTRFLRQMLKIVFFPSFLPVFSTFTYNFAVKAGFFSRVGSIASWTANFAFLKCFLLFSPHFFHHFYCFSKKYVLTPLFWPRTSRWSATWKVISWHLFLQC